MMRATGVVKFNFTSGCTPTGSKNPFSRPNGSSPSTGSSSAANLALKQPMRSSMCSAAWPPAECAINPNCSATSKEALASPPAARNLAAKSAPPFWVMHCTSAATSSARASAPSTVVRVWGMSRPTTANPWLAMWLWKREYISAVALNPFTQASTGRFHSTSGTCTRTLHVSARPLEQGRNLTGFGTAKGPGWRGSQVAGS
mmetsp:Transcript_92876/g.266207  ORF Transcript_92876/g.266207 Transcript_92876/m.266207 type:complete len:201 (+) Transcript_92876:664-1266(+)